MRLPPGRDGGTAERADDVRAEEDARDEVDGFVSLRACLLGVQGEVGRGCCEREYFVVLRGGDD